MNRAYVAAGVALFLSAALSIGYDRWFLEHMFALAPASAYVGQWLQSFKEFPPRQKPGSFNLDNVMEKLTAGSPGSQ
jgi:hypothetical protein